MGREMEEERAYKAHFLVLPFHGQGHMNPMLQFSKRMASRGVKITLMTTLSSAESLLRVGVDPVTVVPIYDDRREGGMHGPGGYEAYFERLRACASRSMTELARKLDGSENPVKCLVYDANLPWAVHIAKSLGLAGVAFFTQSCAAVASYYPMYYESLGKPPPVPAYPMPELPELAVPNIPSLGPDVGRFPAMIVLILKQFDSIEEADLVLFNSYDALEEEVVKWMGKMWPVMTIGPTVPPVFLDKAAEDDRDNGLNPYKPCSGETYMSWLDTKEAGSVVYVSFGSAVKFDAQQMTQMARGLQHSKHSFLWVVKTCEEEANLPSNFAEETEGKGLIVRWCAQLEVLAHRAIGCFVTHSGWNSTVEALSFGVPVVVMPQFLDQMVNAHFMERVWRVGVKPKDGATGEEIARCIGEVMRGAGGLRENAARWKELAMAAVEQGGSSDKHMDEIVARIVRTYN